MSVVSMPSIFRFTGEVFSGTSVPHERSDLSHWRKRLGTKLELLKAARRTKH